MFLEVSHLLAISQLMAKISKSFLDYERLSKFQPDLDHMRARLDQLHTQLLDGRKSGFAADAPSKSMEKDYQKVLAILVLMDQRLSSHDFATMVETESVQDLTFYVQGTRLGSAGEAKDDRRDRLHVIDRSTSGQLIPANAGECAGLLQREENFACLPRSLTERLWISQELLLAECRNTVCGVMSETFDSLSIEVMDLARIELKPGPSCFGLEISQLPEGWTCAFEHRRLDNGCEQMAFRSTGLPYEDSLWNLKQPNFPKRENEFFCLVSGCQQKPFARAADLNQHYKQCHFLECPGKEPFTCDYKNFEKRGSGVKKFGRKDHFRDHLRDYREGISGQVGERRPRGQGERSCWYPDEGEPPLFFQPHRSLQWDIINIAASLCAGGISTLYHHDVFDNGIPNAKPSRWLRGMSDTRYNWLLAAASVAFVGHCAAFHYRHRHEYHQDSILALGLAASVVLATVRHLSIQQLALVVLPWVVVISLVASSQMGRRNHRSAIQRG